MNVIETDRLALEPLTVAHTEEVFAVLSDPAIYEFENQPPASVAALRERYRRWEARGSPDGRERWLNWVVRRRGAELIGYVQATVCPTGRAGIAYEFNSRYWRRGAGCELLAVEEFGAGSDGDWEVPSVGRLPRVLLVVGRKQC